MNKTTILLIALFLVLGGVAWWLTQNEGPKTTLNRENDWYMAVDDPAAVHKVFIANRNGETVTIEKNGKHWIYNNKYKARPNAVDVVMDVVKRVRLKYRPPHTAVKNAVKFIASNGIKVEVYDKNDTNLRTFYVGGTTQDERGTYMMLEGANNPYVMHLPAWEGTIRSRFFFGDNDWRDKTVFAEETANIQKVSVKYPERKDQSFILERKGDIFDLSPFSEETKTPKGKVSQDKVLDYLAGYKNIGAEGFENDNEKVEDVCVGLPFCTVTLTNTSNETKYLDFYPLVQRDENGARVLDQTIERYIAKASTGDYYLVQQLVFGKLFVSYPFFLGKEKLQD